MHPHQARNIAQASHKPCPQHITAPITHTSSFTPTLQPCVRLKRRRNKIREEFIVRPCEKHTDWPSPAMSTRSGAASASSSAEIAPSPPYSISPPFTFLGKRSAASLSSSSASVSQAQALAQARLCTKCNYRGKDAAAVAHHCRLNHSEGATNKKLKKQAAGADAVAEESTAHICSECSFRSISARGLANHRSRKHPKEKKEKRKGLSSIFTNVTWSKQKKTWLVTMKHNGKQR